MCLSQAESASAMKRRTSKRMDVLSSEAVDCTEQRPRKRDAAKRAAKEEMIHCPRAEMDHQSPLRAVAADLSAGDGGLGAELFRGGSVVASEGMDRVDERGGLLPTS